MKRARVILDWVVLLLVAGLISSPPAVAQERVSDTDRECPRENDPDRPERSAEGDRDTHGPRSRPFGGPRGPGMGRMLFQLNPEDRGPLRPGEEQELLAFARERMPHFYEAIEDLRQRNPERVHDKLAEHAPRLRHLRRVFERSPEIGRIIQQHASNEYQMRLDLHRLRREQADSPLYASLMQKLREYVADNVRLETAALKALAARSPEERAQQIESRVAYLLGDDVDLAPVPRKLRKLVEQYHSAADSAQREQAREELKQGLTSFAADELEALQQHIADMEARAAELVDERMERMLERPARHDGGESRGRRWDRDHDRDRERDREP